jgi:hypothetical protein
VVSDPKNPENEGKVFLFKFGKKIMDKITKMMNPDLESEPRINPTDLWKGANFKLKVTRQNVNMGGRNVSFPNYDESVFLAPGPLTEDDSQLEAVWKKEHSLAEIIDRKNFKTYAELKARLDDVLGFTGSAPTPRAPVPVVEEPIDMEGNITYSKKASMPPRVSPVVEEEEDEDLAMFRKLAED